MLTETSSRTCFWRETRNDSPICAAGCPSVNCPTFNCKKKGEEKGLFAELGENDVRRSRQKSNFKPVESDQFQIGPHNITNLMAKKFLPPAFEMAEKASFLGSSASISFAFDGKCLKCGCRADHEPAGKRSYTVRWIRRLSQTILLRQVVRGFSYLLGGFTATGAQTEVNSS